jgi:hypothetical protein
MMVIAKLKNSFARFCIVDTIFSDNGPQFSSLEFNAFCKEFEIRRITSSPHYPQSNGAAESAVKIAKHILSSGDPFKAQLNYNATPIAATGVSPAEGMFGRKIKTALTSLPFNCEQAPVDLEKVRDNDRQYKSRMAYFYNRRNGTKLSRPPEPGESVRIRTDKENDWSIKGTIKEKVAPRSFTVVTDDGAEYRRNEGHIMPDSSTQRPKFDENAHPANETPLRRSSRVVKPVVKMNL